MAVAQKVFKIGDRVKVCREQYLAIRVKNERNQTMRQPNPENVNRCYYCGAKCQPVGKKQELTIFHKSSCRPAKTKDKATGKYEIEISYPGICHGGYV